MKSAAQRGAFSFVIVWNLSQGRFVVSRSRCWLRELLLQLLLSKLQLLHLLLQLHLLHLRLEKLLPQLLLDTGNTVAGTKGQVPICLRRRSPKVLGLQRHHAHRCLKP